ncbi:hypothetical protein SMSP1_01454 [Sedimentisphaera salicampi]|nr:hypothetical protein SMSP1_01454 [Sedimentisphaera salicampi]
MINLVMIYDLHKPSSLFDRPYKSLAVTLIPDKSMLYSG